MLEIIESGDNCDSILLDFSKAFDVIDKGILAHRMKEKGINGKIGVWIFNFLTDRKMSVLCNNTMSKEVEVTSSVPQGTVIAPLLFLIFIDSIGEIKLKNGAFIMTFADDTKLLQKISCEKDAEICQENLEKLFDWEAKNNMKFNAKKICLDSIW